MGSATEAMHDLEILRAACCIAGRDGSVSPQEERLIRRLADRAGVGSVSLKAMIERAEQDRDSYREHFEILKPEPEQAVSSLAAVAAADGQVTTEERALVGHFARKLGMTDERLDEVLTEIERPSGKR
jgi:tellurite resistance protein